jgi:periplasmic divalent cation tolerance protein
MNPDQLIVVFVTAPDEVQAEKLAEHILASRSAACVNILPAIKSLYRWQGRIERASEVLLIIKTVSSAFAKLQSEILAIHSYDTPEILAINAADCSESYAGWLRTEVVP